MSKPIEAALKKIPNRFLLTTVVARRWESIVAGSPPLVDYEPGTPPLRVVFKEILEDKIELDHEERLILLSDLPHEEESNETLFSSAFSPDAANVKEIMGSGDGD
ncbi:MAG: DNA-directed RNA polymerase subunit omega [Acidobacteriota bacterium]|nr:DNA-directed RNA polymerase subunit omega [Acidobacteriota bacterium]MDQ7086889.1 DNA-directed RNA polymerase subunit omega [Acidobacteriota bacterium]